MLHIFFLGRERLLSLSEIFAVFPQSQCREVGMTHCYVEGMTDEAIQTAYPFMGGIIKVIRVDRTVSSTESVIPLLVETIAEACPESGKFSFAIGYYGTERRVFRDGLLVKNALKKQGKSVRLINHDDANITSATYRHEHLDKKGMELNAVWNGATCHIGPTICYQDIGAYTARDIGRERDMQVGMLPPKLAQTMLNLATMNRGVYDPFCGLGTVLIEAMHARRPVVMGSDLSKEMERASRENIAKYTTESWNSTETYVWCGDARSVGTSPDSRKALARCDIVTEGFLGRIFGLENITRSLVLEESRKLATLYRDFFGRLEEGGYHGIVVITFPVWHIGRDRIFFDERGKILRDTGFRIVPLLASGQGSKVATDTLVYRRPGQTVGREVVRIQR